MATPRKRWFRVADSILREDWSDATLATHMRLMAWLNQRWSRDGIDHAKAGSATIGAIDAMAITRTQAARAALRKLARHPREAGLSTARASLDNDAKPTRVFLEWDKFPEFQEYGSGPGARRSPEISPSDSDSDTETREEQEGVRAEDSCPSAVGKVSSAEGVPTAEDVPQGQSPRARDQDQDVAKPARKRTPRRKPAQQALVESARVLPPEPHARSEALLKELRRYGRAPYSATDAERRLWLEAELPGMEAWCEDAGKSLAAAVHAWWKRYCDKGERRWKAEAEKLALKEAIRRSRIERGLDPDERAPPGELGDDRGGPSEARAPVG